MQNVRCVTERLQRAAQKLPGSRMRFVAASIFSTVLLTVESFWKIVSKDRFSKLKDFVRDVGTSLG